MTSVQKKRGIVIIYDGECGFCKECVRWVEKKTVITALPFQSADLARYGLAYERCSKEVVVVINGKVFGGASAVAKLLRASGYKKIATLLTLSGALGRTGYSWVSAHRNSALIRLLHRVLRAINRKS
jgi:predicted DCC family thiol-disulfide oxidoreductase YuxK